MPAAGQPTAEGELGQTPFAHLVVYAMERKLTGTLQLEEQRPSSPSGSGPAASSEPDIHRLTFVRGAPAKIKPADPFARLGRLLTDEGLIDDATLEGALTMHGLLGDALVLAGHVAPEALESVLERQFRLRFVRMFALDASVKYRYYEGLDELADWGAEHCRIDPYELLWSGLERHAEKASSMEPSLAALAEDQPLVVHPKAPLDRFALEGQVADVVDLLLLEPMTFAEVCELDIAPIELVRRVVYAMLLLRCFDLGRGALPVGIVEKGPTTLARVQVKQSVRRLVAAAPDEAGDGEQRQRPRVGRKTDPRSDPNPDAEPSSTDEPVSSSAPTSGEAPASSGKVAASIASDGATSSASPPTTKSQRLDDVRPAEMPPKPALTPPPAKPNGPPKRAALLDGVKTLGSETSLEAATDANRIREHLPASAEPTKKEPGPTKKEPEPTKKEPEPDSSVRAVRSAIPGTPTPELLSLARTRIEAKDASVAVVLAEAAVEREPGLVEARLLAAYARTLVPHADLKAMAVEIDDIVRSNEAFAEARYYRGCLRKRLGDDTGAKRDFEKAHDLDPMHPGARLEVKGAETATEPAKRGGLLGRLFRR